MKTPLTIDGSGINNSDGLQCLSLMYVDADGRRCAAELVRRANAFDQLVADNKSLREALERPAWLVWSNEHAAWWGPNQCDYSSTIENAGRYTLEEAIHISQMRSLTAKGRESGNPSELIQPSPEWIAARDAALATKGGV